MAFFRTNNIGGDTSKGAGNLTNVPYSTYVEVNDIGFRPTRVYIQGNTTGSSNYKFTLMLDLDNDIDTSNWNGTSKPASDYCQITDTGFRFKIYGSNWTQNAAYYICAKSS